MSSSNTELARCPFRNPLITHDFACENGREITRREGPDIGCVDAAANQACKQVFEAAKAAALSALDLEDDLTSLPASMLSKIQYGTLLGLYADIHQQGTEAVENIHALINLAGETYPGVDHLPIPQMVEAISSFRLKRRRER